LWNLHLQRLETRELGVNVARAYLLSDNRYRRWNALHGGVYIRADNEFQQRSLPFDVEDQEIITTSGRRLLLIDHASMMDQVYELSGPDVDAYGELKSLDPISKRGVANDWEKAALKSLKNGKKEVWSVTKIEDEDVVFIMRPFVIEEPCLKCHERGGYRVGDIRGGITVRIPLEKFGIANRPELKMLQWGHLFWWRISISYLVMRSRIIERKIAEAALENLRYQQEQILSAAGEGIYGIDSKGITTFVNPAAAKMLGWDPEELIGQNQHEVIHHTNTDGLSYPEVQCPVSASIYDGKIHQGTDEWYIRKDGSTFPIDFISSPLLENGEVKGAVITFADVSARKKAEEDMVNAQQYLQNIINAMPSILIVVDYQCRVTLWNSEAAKVTVFELKEASGKQLAEVFPLLSDNIIEIEDAVVQQVVQKMESVYSAFKKEESRYMDIIIYPLKLDNFRGAVIRIDDVTERVIMEDRLVQSEKITSVIGLVEGMAHEINNPLGGIIQGAQNVIRRLSPELEKNVEVAEKHGIDLTKVKSYMDDRQVIKFLQGIRSSGKRAADIISYMLQFSQVHDAPKELRNLQKLLESLLNTIIKDEEDSRKDSLNKIELIKDYDPNLPDVPCISSEIEQVMRNIIHNAQQALLASENSIAEPKIILRTRHVAEENMVLIEVEDNGPGMDETVQRRVFEPFFTTKPPGEGVGLGLAVSYFIITVAHQGLMNVKSTPGKGTIFSVHLPLYL
jgi:PAS domain S-box-containing protein